MRSKEAIARKYIVDQIRLLAYSMTDSIYDIIFNSYETLEGWRVSDSISDALVSGRNLTDEETQYILKQMSRDIEAGIYMPDRCFYDFVFEFIKTYHNLAFRAIRHYTGSLIEARLHPDIVATNGCNKGYLFLNTSHPKHKLNASMKEEVDIIVDDIYGNDKNLGDL